MTGKTYIHFPKHNQSCFGSLTRVKGERNIQGERQKLRDKGERQMEQMKLADEEIRCDQDITRTS